MTDTKDRGSFQKADIYFFERILRLYRLAGQEMQRKGFTNWSYFYPPVSTILNDIHANELYILLRENTLLGVISITEQQDEKYKAVKWNPNVKKSMYINRLAVHPRYQGAGLGSVLMDKAQQIAVEKNCEALRLDAYSPNNKLLEFYQKRGFIIHKETISLGFPWQHPFCCLEKYPLK